ncbi:MAG TPA: response regulator [Candidatus Paceibacterota bacterium]
MRVLFVDDNALLAISDASVAADYGHEGVTAISGNEACKLLAKEHFDAIITDMQMPDGNGLVILEWVHAHALHIPTLLHSGNDFHLVNGDLIPLREEIKKYPFAQYAPKAAYHHVECFLESVANASAIAAQ